MAVQANVCDLPDAAQVEVESCAGGELLVGDPESGWRKLRTPKNKECRGRCSPSRIAAGRGDAGRALPIPPGIEFARATISRAAREQRER